MAQRIRVQRQWRQNVPKVQVHVSHCLAAQRIGTYTAHKRVPDWALPPAGTNARDADGLAGHGMGPPR